MITVNLRFALSIPAFVSALSKKTFSSVNCPILACNAFRLTFDWAGNLSKIPEAFSINCRFQVVVWLG